jgi:hypothetical protein
MQTLAEMKRHLATPDATLTMTNYEVLKDEGWKSSPPRHSGARKVAKLQTNAVSLYTDGTRSGVSWLYFGKASNWEFSGNVAICTDGTIRMTYEVN